jgi:hypothetical protein
VTGRHRRGRPAAAFTTHAVSVLVAGLVLAGAAVVKQTTPDEVRQQAAFVVRGDLSAPVVARDLVVTVHDVTVADVVTATAFGRISEHTSNGAWVLVDASVSTQLEPGYAQTAQLVIDGRTYRSTNRFAATLTEVELQPGLAMRGHFAFEIPADVTDQVVTLEVARAFDTRLDSIANLTLNLAEAPREDEVAVARPVLEAVS